MFIVLASIGGIIILVLLCCCCCRGGVCNVECLAGGDYTLGQPSNRWKGWGGGWGDSSDGSCDGGSGGGSDGAYI